MWTQHHPYYPHWDPGGVVMTRVDATHWTITLTGKESTQIEYKYALGSWDYGEKGAIGDLILVELLQGVPTA